MLTFVELRQVEQSVKGKTLTWEESTAPASDTPEWHSCSGIIKALSRRNDGYYVLDMHGACRWIRSVYEQYRNIKIEE